MQVNVLTVECRLKDSYLALCTEVSALRAVLAMAGIGCAAGFALTQRHTPGQLGTI